MASVFNDSALWVLPYDLFRQCMCNPHLCPFEAEQGDFSETELPPDYAYDYLSHYHSVLNCSADWVRRGTTTSARLTVAGKIAVAFLYTLTVLFTIFSNSLIIVVLSCGRQAGSDMTKYLINLSVADIMIGVFCMPYAFTYIILLEWPFGEAMCPFMYFIQHVSVCVSIFTLTAIGIDRYHAVIHPLQRRLSKSRSAVILSTLWVLALGVGVVQLAITRTFTADSGTVQCGERWSNPRVRLFFECFLVSIVYVIPSIVFFYTYRAIASKLWNRSVPGDDALKSRNSARKKMKVIRMVVVFVLVFFLCWLPLNVFNIVTHLLSSRTDEGTILIIYVACHWIAMVNSCLNPIIYTFLQDEFKADVRDFCTNYRRFRMRMRRHLGNNSQFVFRSSTSQSVLSTTATLGTHASRASADKTCESAILKNRKISD